MIQESIKQFLKPAVINGTRQNCFVLGTRTASAGTISSEPEKKYKTIDRVNLPNGYYDTVVEKDYPINSDSVTSYADGADYRNDPLQAIANAPKRVNLGDVTQLQDFVQNDPQNAVRVFRDVLSRLESVQKQSVPAPSAESKTDAKLNGGE